MKLLLLIGCFLFRRDSPDHFDMALEAADELFEQRADPQRLEEAIDAYVLIQASAPGDPRVLLRLSRAFTARAETLPPLERRKELELARGYGLECLSVNPGFASRWDLAGGRVTPQVARLLTAADAPCLATTLYAWVRWAEQRGAAAGIDLPALQALSDRAAALPTGWVGPWSQGMLILIAPGPVEHDLFASREALELSILLSPGRATAHADLVRWQLVREEDAEGFAQEVAGFPQAWPEDYDDEWGLENRVARDRVADLAGEWERLVYEAWVQKKEKGPEDP